MIKSNYVYRPSRRYRRRYHRQAIRKLTIGVVGTVLAGSLMCGSLLLWRAWPVFWAADSEQVLAVSSAAAEMAAVEINETDTIALSQFMAELAINTDSLRAFRLKQAARLAAGYDYDAAIELLQQDDGHLNDPSIQQAIADYEAEKNTLAEADYKSVTHVFFHSLVMDNSKAFDGEATEAGYNQVMTTASEFTKILETMYAKGYVLVRLHDLASETVDENGKTVMKPGSIMLPEGKKPFVMSQDDVCYYPYMDGDGFASRMIVGENGKPVTEMKLDDGTISVGSYDLVPILEDFIQEHPDFSYRGARAVLAFTGYEGVLGYRTAASYQDSDTYEQERKEAAEVAQCLRDNGWELASHSWGHRNLGSISYESFQTDCDKWENEVETIIGPTDIILFPFGSDIGDWYPYQEDNERYQYLYSLGFRYYCNVDSNQYWVQLGDQYLRQGRRNLDGYRMWKDITETDPARRKLDDLFKAEDVFDADRPTPVPDM